MSSSSEDGSDLEDEFKEKHECTDVACTGLFIAALLAFAGVMCWALAEGDTRKLLRGIDVSGQLCGLSENVSDRPFLYFCPLKVSSSLRELAINIHNPVCLSSCPTGDFDTNTNTTSVIPQSVPECGQGATETYLAKSVSGIYCLPAAYYSSSAASEVKESVSSILDSLDESISDLSRSWPVLVLVVIVATILGYVYLWLLRVTAKILIWLCALVSIVALIGLGVYIWTKDLSDEDAASVLGEDTQVQQSAWYAKQALAVLCWVLAVVVAILACCCGGAIELSTACVQTGTLVIWRMPLMLLSPLIKAITKCFLMLLFIYGGMHLWAMADVSGRGLHRRLHRTPEQWGVILFYMYVAFWVLAFVSALYQFSIAYAVAKYYKAPEDEEGDRDVDSFAVVEGTVVGLMKHTGSLAFGAAIIALFEVAQRILEYAERKNEELGEDANKCVRCILSCCLCCCKCCEGIVQFINKNAYIDIAVTGDNNFCQAVRNVMHTVIDFGAAMAILNGATVIFQIVGMVSITALCGLVAFSLLTSKDVGFADRESSWYVGGDPVVPTVVACILAFTVAWAFMAIFDVTTDTLLYCYAEDKREHGSARNAPADMRSLYEEAEREATEQKSKTGGGNVKGRRFGRSR